MVKKEKEVKNSSERRVWTTEELEFLRENYLNFNSVEIGYFLCRSLFSIRHKLSKLDLKKDEESLRKTVYIPFRTGENSPTKRLEVRKKMSESQKGKKRNPLSEDHKIKISLGNKGKRMSDESKLKIRIFHLGRKLSQETKEKISISKSNPSQETRLKMSLAKKGKSLSEEHKRKIGLRSIGRKHSQNFVNMMKEMRKNQIFPFKDSSIEIKIQNFLSLLHIEFFTHKYISEISHAYQCDIFIPVQEGINQKIIIEADGCYWHGCLVCRKNKSLNERQKKQIEYDKTRVEELIEKDFRVIRLKEHDINGMNLEKFREKLDEI